LKPLGSLGIITSPFRTLGELATAPRWQAQFVALCMCTIGASLAIRPFTRKATLLHLQSLLSDDELERALDYVDQWFCVGLILAPLLLLAKFGCLAVIIRTTGAMLGLAAEFRKIFTVVVWSSTAVVLEGVFICSILWIRGLESVQTTDDLEVPLGLNLIVPNADPIVFDLLGSLNPFDLWFVGLLALGIAQVHSIHVWRGILIVSPIGIGGVALRLAIRFVAL